MEKKEERCYCKCTHYGFVMNPGENRRHCYSCGRVFSDTDGLTIDEVRMANYGYSARSAASSATSLPLERPGTRSVPVRGGDD